MAEVLTGADDEILFVDYHTPHGMPTLPEAIEDTLTDRAIDLMRVLRVTPEMHMAAVGDRSRLPISEPHARNTAIRRAKPGNWVLSTNTDMVFVPRGEKSLTDLVAELDGDAYCLPRFEIPEWLWESVPRDNPRRMIELLREWGERVGLDEVTLGHDWILYDAPGDFQLVRRELMEEVHGFDEAMIHGWHVDSNLWKRIYNRTGHIGTLYPEIAGYHTNHNRTLTRLMQAHSSGNDLGHFVYEVEHSSLPAQADTWGFAGIDVTEVPLGRANPLPLLMASAVRAAGQGGPLITSDTREQMSVLEYDARHILPFALDPVIGEFPRSSVGYVGINHSTSQMLEAAAAELGCPDGLTLGDDAARGADVVILDMGIDASTGRGPLTRDEAETLLPALQQAISILHTRDPQPQILLINATSGIWEEWVQAQFGNMSTYGAFPRRVQQARLHSGFARCDVTDRVRHTLHFLTRSDEVMVDLTERVVRVDLPGELGYAGLAEGWESGDVNGAYVGSGPASLQIRLDDSLRKPVRCAISLTWTPTADPQIIPIRVECQLTTEKVVADIHPNSSGEMTLDMLVPSLDRGRHFLIINAGTPSSIEVDAGSKPNLLPTRIRLSSVTFTPIPGRQKDALIQFIAGTDDCTLLGPGWNSQEPHGAWTRDTHATISWMSDETIPAGMPLTIFGWCIDPAQQTLHASINGTPVEQALGDDGRMSSSVTFPDRIAAGGLVELQIVCTPVVRASALGYDDNRHLGCFVSGIALGQASTESPEDTLTLVPTGPVSKPLPSLLQRITGRLPQASHKTFTK